MKNMVLAALAMLVIFAPRSSESQVNGPFRFPVIALTDDQRLLSTNRGNPEQSVEIGSISGLQAPDTEIIGIDFRIQDRLLYGLGNGGGVYTIDPGNAQATFVNALTVALQGTQFGVDFNPAADRLRIISDTGQNLRHNVNIGGTTTADTNLTTPTTDVPSPDPTTMATTGVSGAAYTNNDLQASSGTTLFDINTANDTVIIQSPANSGRLASTGSLGFNASDAVGFDIFSKIFNEAPTSNKGFAVLNVDGTVGFYRINLLTGAAKLRGTFNDVVVDIAVPLDD